VSGVPHGSEFMRTSASFYMRPCEIIGRRVSIQPRGFRALDVLMKIL
jgi:hypothetical protein